MNRPVLTYKIYALLDPTQEEYKYIGKTSCGLLQRLSGHVHKAKRGKDQSIKSKWILSLLNDNKKPIIKELYSSNEDWQVKEKEYISLHKPIYNTRKGGGSDDKIKLNDEILSLMGVIADREIGEKFGFSTSTISLHRRKLGIQKIKQDFKYRTEAPLFTFTTRDIPIELVNQIGILSDAEIARRANVTSQCIDYRRKRLGIAKAKSHMIGEANPMTKFTWDIVTEIRSIYNSGKMSITGLAKQFNSSYATIYRVIKNQVWVK